jgi:hypothetical protein
VILWELFHCAYHDQDQDLSDFVYPSWNTVQKSRGCRKVCSGRMNALCDDNIIKSGFSEGMPKTTSILQKSNYDVREMWLHVSIFWYVPVCISPCQLQTFQHWLVSNLCESSIVLGELNGWYFRRPLILKFERNTASVSGSSQNRPWNMIDWPLDANTHDVRKPKNTVWTGYVPRDLKSFCCMRERE